MTSSLAKSKQITGAHFKTLFLQFSYLLVFLNIQIGWIILKTCDQQFTLTTKKSLHITFKMLMLDHSSTEFVRMNFSGFWGKNCYVDWWTASHSLPVTAQSVRVCCTRRVMVSMMVRSTEVSACPTHNIVTQLVSIKREIRVLTVNTVYSRRRRNYLIIYEDLAAACICCKFL